MTGSTQILRKLMGSPDTGGSHGQRIGATFHESSKRLKQNDLSVGWVPRLPLMEVDVTRYETSSATMINWDTDGDRFIFVEPLRDADARPRIEVTLDWAHQLSPTTSR